MGSCSAQGVEHRADRLVGIGLADDDRVLAAREREELVLGRAAAEPGQDDHGRVGVRLGEGAELVDHAGRPLDGVRERTAPDEDLHIPVLDEGLAHRGEVVVVGDLVRAATRVARLELLERHGLDAAVAGRAARLVQDLARVRLAPVPDGVPLRQGLAPEGEQEGAEAGREARVLLRGARADHDLLRHGGIRPLRLKVSDSPSFGDH